MLELDYRTSLVQFVLNGTNSDQKQKLVSLDWLKEL